MLYGLFMLIFSISIEDPNENCFQEHGAFSLNICFIIIIIIKNRVSTSASFLTSQQDPPSVSSLV